MNLQEKMLEASSEIRSRMAALAASALEAARGRANLGRRVADLKKSISVLNGARLQLRKVAGRHASHFVKQNAMLVSAVHKDVSALARSTYASLSTRPLARKARRVPMARKRSAKAA
jgi:hypothetical protein